MTTTRHTRTLHGHRMAYLEAAPAPENDTGEVVVLIHGIAGSAAVWQDILDRFERQGSPFRLIAPDMLGHGESAGVGGDFSLGAYANGLRDLLAVLGHRRVTVVGHSLGGGVALQFAYQFPEMCSRLVLVASGGLGRTVSGALRFLTVPGAGYLLPWLSWTRMFGVTAAGMRLAAELPGADEVSLREYARHIASLGERAHLDAFSDTVRALIAPSGQRVSSTDRLYLTEGLPTMIVWGDRDPVLPVGHARRAAVLIPHARVEVFAGSGHFPQSDEPERFAQLLREFIADTEPATLDAAEIGTRLAAREA